MAGQPVAASFRCGPTGVSGAGGSGRCVCRWAAARPRAVRAASLWLGASSRSPAAREIATREPAARSGRSRSPPVPSGPSGALHTGGAWCTDVWLGASAQSLARPRRRPRALQSGPPVPPAPSTPVGPGVLTFVTSAAHWSSGQAPPPPTGTAVWPSGPSGSLHTGGAVSLECGWGRVVTNVVNLRAFSLIMVVFGLGLTTFVTGVFVRRFKSWWFDDVCNVGRPLVARPGPATGHGYRIWVL